MYEIVTHTINFIKGLCEFLCLYCFMDKLSRGRLKPARLDESEFRTDLGSGNFIFVGSSIDMWAPGIPDEWILRVLDYCALFDNRYLFQSKGPERFLQFVNHPLIQSGRVVFCTTIESDIWYPEVQGRGTAPRAEERAEAMAKLHALGFETYVTAEPCMKFSSPQAFAELLLRCSPSQVNIGKNTHYGVTLPEPTAEEVQDLAAILQQYTRVETKKNSNKWFNK